VTRLIKYLQNTDKPFLLSAFILIIWTMNDTNKESKQEGSPCARKSIFYLLMNHSFESTDDLAYEKP